MHRIKCVVILFLALSLSTKAQINIGDTLPTVTLKNNSNIDVNVSSFKGKYILIDFWASWCLPCRLGNKKLVKFYQQVSSTKIQIVGISVDADKNKWLKAIAKDKIKFTQLLDPNGFDASTAIRFGVEELPSKFLFNPNGVLIAKNPTEKEILKFINN